MRDIANDQDRLRRSWFFVIFMPWICRSTARWVLIGSSARLVEAEWGGVYEVEHVELGVHRALNLEKQLP